MVDSTNPRILAGNIRALAKKIASIVPGTVVEGNPSGSGFNTLLTKIKIGSNKYKLPDQVTANSEDEATEALTKLKIGSNVYGIEAGGLDYGTSETKIGKYKGSDLYAAEVTFSGSFINGANNVLMSGSDKTFIGYASDISVLKETVLNKFVNIDSICGVPGINDFYIYIDSDKHTIGYHTSIAGGGYGITSFSIYVLYTK